MNLEAQFVKKVDLGYIVAISLLIALFLIPTLVNTGLYEKLPVYVFFVLLFAVFPLFSVFGMIIFSFVGKKLLVLWQFAKFAMVGVLNTAIDFGILNLLIFVTGITSGLAIIPLNAVSFSTAVFNSFFWNKKWVFKAGKDANFITFFAVTLIGLLINTSIVYLITTFVSPVFVTSENLWANIAKAVATGVALVWNFAGYKIIVFRR